MAVAIERRQSPSAAERAENELRNAALARAFWEAPDDALFPPEVIAAVRRVSALTISMERYAGKGPAYYKPGKVPLYRKKDVVAFIEESRNEPGE